MSRRRGGEGKGRGEERGGPPIANSWVRPCICLQITNVTDGQIDGQTRRHTMAIARYPLKTKMIDAMLTSSAQGEQI